MAKSRVEQQLEELDKLRARGRVSDEEYEIRRQAILTDTTSVQSPSSKGKGIFKWGMLGCLGIFGAIGILVVIVIVAIVAAVGSGDEEDDSGGDVRVALAAGTSGEIAPQFQGNKRIKVTLLQVVDGAASNNQFLNPDPGRKYWAVEVEVENIGTEEVNSPSWKLRDSKSLEHDRTFFSDVGENLDTSFDLTPGGKLKGWVVFEIDQDAQPVWLRADPNVIAKYDLYFDAP